ncbi:hypothetical protein TorRG33x02_241770 [Trema orientale]|uniref:Uncharacterized protein n=1 Tax=Trema orientale TaxID=63057 RepID=A0A2P5DTW9_TREOI|nr:hypothetical protein TorRG33x02_241770 [Trema orientale]
MGKNTNKETRFSSTVRSFVSCFNVSGEGEPHKKTTKVVFPAAAGPEASMIAAGKHFSSKVRLI